MCEPKISGTKKLKKYLNMTPKKLKKKIEIIKVFLKLVKGLRFNNSLKNVGFQSNI